MLALKLAELTNVEATLGEAPVLLLDDVPSELDPTRRALLFEVIARLDCQTLISVTERDIVPAAPERATFGSVRSDRVRRVRDTACYLYMPHENARLLETFRFVASWLTSTLRRFR